MSTDNIIDKTISELKSGYDKPELHKHMTNMMSEVNEFLSNPKNQELNGAQENFLEDFTVLIETFNNFSKTEAYGLIQHCINSDEKTLAMMISLLNGAKLRT